MLVFSFNDSTINSLHARNLHTGMIVLSAIVGTRDHRALGIGFIGRVPAEAVDVGASQVPQGLEHRDLHTIKC